MPTHDDRDVLCAHCGERIDATEGAWRELTDGTLRATKPHTLDKDAGPQIFHTHCFTPARLRSP